MLVFPIDFPRERVALVQRFLLSCPLIELFSRSSQIYRVVSLAPAQHGYPPQVTIHTPTGLPLVVDVAMPEDVAEARAA